ncbi:MAG TPA: hypothetical protein VMU54_06420 [Planctomycetota bacterium]|nr:hypothetical protein [Planctomycetota bacterium]
MVILDAEATFVKLDKLRQRMDRLEKSPDANEWQYTRLLIRALTEGIAKAKKSTLPISRKIQVDAPAPVSGDWEELVEVLQKKGIKSEGRRAALKRK